MHSIHAESVSFYDNILYSWNLCRSG